MDLIIGRHSIGMAIQNNQRATNTLYTTTDAAKELKDYIPKTMILKDRVKIIQISKEKWSQELQKLYKKANLNPPNRVSSNMILETSQLEIFDSHWLNQNVESGKVKKIFCLDQVSDVENAGAIVRSAAFYGADVFLIPVKGTFRFTPAFYRKASGGAELVNFVQVPHLPKLIRKLQSMGVLCIGLSEHEKTPMTEVHSRKENPICLVVGNEEKGISNAVQRSLEHLVAIKGRGAIKSLNVSVASAIAMSKYFYQC